MIDSAACREIIQTYVKHGWILRRVLLTPELSKSLGKASDELFGNVTVSEHHIAAAWFSRPPGKGEIAWEIRVLSETAFALLEYLDEASDDFERKLSEVQDRLVKSLATKRNT